MPRLWGGFIRLVRICGEKSAICHRRGCTGWVYRSAECGYTGRAVADEKDQPTTDPKKDKCSGSLRGCQLRNNVANYGGFVGVNKLG